MLALRQTDMCKRNTIVALRQDECRLRSYIYDSSRRIIQKHGNVPHLMIFNCFPARPSLQVILVGGLHITLLGIKMSLFTLLSSDEKQK